MRILKHGDSESVEIMRKNMYFKRSGIKLFVCNKCNYGFFADATQYTVSTDPDVMGWISEIYNCTCPNCQHVITISLLF